MGGYTDLMGHLGQSRSIVLCALAVTACATSNAGYKADVDRTLAHAHPGNQIAEPTTFAPKPWKVGQWAIYKRRVGTELGYETISVVAEDACGIWIARVVKTYQRRSSSLLCFRAGDDRRCHLGRRSDATQRRCAGVRGAPTAHEVLGFLDRRS